MNNHYTHKHFGKEGPTFMKGAVALTTVIIALSALSALGLGLVFISVQNTKAIIDTRGFFAENSVFDACLEEASIRIYYEQETYDGTHRLDLLDNNYCDITVTTSAPSQKTIEARAVTSDSHYLSGTLILDTSTNPFTIVSLEEY
jgi:hypothetical protein